MTDRMRHLVDVLNEASRVYYQGDGQIMSDMEYDALYDELVELEQTLNMQLPDSPTQKVGYDVVSSLQKAEHTVPMLSLAKTKDVHALPGFLGAETGLLSWKLDGITIVLNYEGGKLVRAVTRGNGRVGEDVTHNARVFRNVPKNIACKDNLTIRGEAVISFEDFNRNNDKLEIRYKNPRNFTSGAVRQLDSAVTAKRGVMFFAFSLPGAKGIGDSKQRRLEWLSELGFGVAEYRTVTSETVVEAAEEFKRRIPKNEYATDGLVLTFDDITYSEGLGITAKFPRDSIALKWEDEQAETTFLGVEWNTSRTGLINPVALFEPVELEGTTVERASLHNVSVLEALELGEGDTVTVYKANMIIPQVADNITRTGGLAIPGHCPVCGFDTEFVQMREGRALRCPNPNCKAQAVRALAHFASRDAMNIEGLSEATIEKLVDTGIVSDYASLYGIGHYAEQIIAIEGFGKKSLDKLLAALERSKDVELPNFIYALGISNVGLVGAKLLCAKFNNDIERIIGATEEELITIDGFGKVIAASIHQYFNDDKNRQLFLSFLPTLRLKAGGSDGVPQTLSGMTFVITGSLSHFDNRNALKAYIENKGGKVTGTVTSNTTYLINNDIASASSKNKKAMELGVTIINETQLLSL